MNTVRVEYKPSEVIQSNKFSGPIYKKNNNGWKSESSRQRLFQNLDIEEVYKDGLKRHIPAYTYYTEFANRMITVNNGKYYLKSIAEKHKDYISLNSSIIGGMPAIACRRIPVSLVIACFRDGMSVEEICEDYSLSSGQLIASLDYAIDVLDRPFHEE